MEINRYTLTSRTSLVVRTAKQLDEPFYHAPVDVHIRRLVPLVRFVVEALDVVDGGDAVEAADDEDHVVDDLDGEVASGIVHVRDLRPSVRGRAVLLPAAHPGDAVEAPDDVDVAVVGDARHPRPPGPHGADRGPLVDGRVVHFGRVHALLPVEAAGYVDFAWKRGGLANVKFLRVTSKLQDVILIMFTNLTAAKLQK